jgi:hypothetical protein
MSTSNPSLWFRKFTPREVFGRVNRQMQPQVGLWLSICMADQFSR